MMLQPNQRAALGKWGVLVTICIIASVGLSGCSRAAHYRAYHDAESLFGVLHDQVKPGDTQQHVQELLGQGQPPDKPEKCLARARKFAERQPQAFPAGVRDDDRFLQYSAGNLGVMLQFRDGRLINFDPNEYERLPVGSLVASP